MRILRIKQVLDKCGLGKTTLYKLVNERTFPQPVALGERAVGWVESEIEVWITQRIAERNASGDINSPDLIPKQQSQKQLKLADQ